MTDVLGAIALLLLITGGGAAAMRRAYRPSRYRPRPGARYGRGPARQRKSWLVTAAKAAGVNLKSDHLDGATAELTGKATGHSIRGAGRLARWAGRHTGRVGLAAGRRAETLAARRWEARGEAGRVTPLLWRNRRRASPEPGQDPPGDPAPGDPPPADGTPSPATSPAAGSPPPPAPDGGQKEVRLMRQRYSINLEPPATDAEFLESCVQLGDVLKALAEEVSNWADGLSSLHLPPSVLSPLNNLCEGIEEAATGAADAAKAFEDEFEDARDVASRGMHFTGQDAA